MTSARHQHGTSYRKETRDRVYLLLIGLVWIVFWSCNVSAGPPSKSVSTEMEQLAGGDTEINLSTGLLRRIDELEQTVAQLQKAEVTLADSTHSSTHETAYETIYDAGWTLRPRDAAKTPYELKFGLHNQFRYTGFSRDEPTSIDAAGNVRSIAERNDFNINRGRLVFSGYAFDEDFGFYANIDYSTVASDSIQPLLAWISFRFSENLQIFTGLGKVPGTWEWQQTSRYTLGADRTMATTFFRPSITAGIWGIGNLTDKLAYTVFIGNGFNTLTLRSSELDTNFVYSAMTSWEPLEDFGVGFSDIENHQTPALRLGHALTQTSNDSIVTNQPGAEETVVRLSDGTRLVEPNALAPGVTVNAFDIWLYSVHAGMKYRGLSFASEIFLRWLTNIEANDNTPQNSLFDHGFYVQAGKFVIPETVELFARASAVDGEFGSGHEVSVGFNWHLFNQRSARMTFDVTHFEDSPAEQSRTGYIAGGSGTLFRTQLWTFF